MVCIQRIWDTFGSRNTNGVRGDPRACLLLIEHKYLGMDRTSYGGNDLGCDLTVLRQKLSVSKVPSPRAFRRERMSQSPAVMPSIFVSSNGFG